MKDQSQIQNKNHQFSREIETIIGTTNPQLEIWTDCLIGGDDANKAYNLSYSIILKGNLVVKALERAINEVVLRHESLRATFSSDGTYMNIYEDLKIDITQYNLSHLPTDEKEREKEILIRNEINSLFDLVSGPLFRVKLFKIDDLENILILTHHHIIGDGLAINIIIEELSILYSAFVEKTVAKLKTPERFSDYAKKVNSLIDGGDYKQIEDFWLSIYKKSVPKIELPIDLVRPSLRTYNSQRLDFPIKSELIDSIKQIGIKADCSLTTTLLVTFELFLYKLTGQNELVVGFPTSGNRRYNMNHLIGDCANLLPLRSSININNSFIETLKQRNNQLQDAYVNHQVSFGSLLQKLAIARDPSRIPLVPVTLTIDLNNEIESDFSFTGLTYEFKINPRDYASFEIQVHAFRSKEGPILQCSYNTSLFKEATIHQMMISFEDIFNKLINSPTIPLSEIISGDYLTDYIELNNTETLYPKVSLSHLLSQQAEKSPDKIAIEYNNIKINYKDLHIKVNQFAHYLKENGVIDGDYIAVSYPRSPELAYAILAIIQCGAAYLPLDHQYPTKRVEYMLEDSQAKYLLTSKELSLSLPKCSNTILIDDAMSSLHTYPSTKLETDVDPENILYLLYTSGSTGKPKGAKITNKNVVNLFCSLEKEPGIKETDRVPFISTISFDIASFELFFPLYKGATLVIPNHDTPSDGRLFNEMLEKEKISLIVATPTTYQMLLDSGWTKKLPIKIWCCGEPLPAKLAKELIARSEELWTLYGPTEVTIFSSCKHIKTEDTIISVGGPIDNMQYYIVDENCNLLPPNTIGEIAIGGDGVGKGYLGRPDLTASKYVPNKFSKKEGDIMYLSGDIGKLLLSNEVMCLGRIDHQVKVRGHRIEIGEIEHVLMSIEGIKSAVVLANEDILMAFIITESKLNNETEGIRFWRNELALQLPAFMVPHVFHILEKMPKTLNDKIDRKALLEYKSTAKDSQEFTAPRTEHEKLIAAIWQESLKKERIDIFSNFFELGGHSLIAVNVMIKIEKATGERLPLSALFEHSTVEKLAKLLHQDKRLISWDSLVPIRPKGTKTPLYIVHGAGLNVLIFNALAKNLDDDQPVFGLQAKGLNGIDEPFGTIEEIASFYVDSIMFENPDGPYALAGYSFGGIIAYEMAHQFSLRGKKVTMVGILDTNISPEYYHSNPIRKKIAASVYSFRSKIWILKKMLTNWEHTKERVRTKKESIKNLYLAFKIGKEKQHELKYNQPYQLDKMNNLAMSKYHLVPRPFEIDLFRVDNPLYYLSDPEFLGWNKVALNGVQIHEIQGDHYEIFSPPNDYESARIMQKVLDQRNAEI